MTFLTLHEIRDCNATAADRDTPFHNFLFACLTHLLILSLQKSDHRSRGHATLCPSHVSSEFAEDPHFACVCVHRTSRRITPFFLML